MRLVKIVAVFAVLAWVGCPYTEGCEAGSDPGDYNPEGGTGTSSGTSGSTSGSLPKEPREPNCKGLKAQCNGESCCTASNIPGGTFNRLNDPALPATVGDFRLDVYEVTVGRFRAFVNAGMGIKKTAPKEGDGKNPNDPTDKGWQEDWDEFLSDDTDSFISGVGCSPDLYPAFDPAAGEKNDSLPMNCANWAEAQAFCIWDGGRLPTEAEWNYAAAGGSEQRVLPNGDATASEDQITFGCQSGTSVAEEGAPKCTFKDFIEVGSHKDGRGRWGQQDMSGSAWERIYDWYVDIPDMPKPCDNCAVHDEPPSKGRVFRGGALNWSKAYQLTTDRTSINTELLNDRTDSVGFRCARKSTN